MIRCPPLRLAVVPLLLLVKTLSSQSTSEISKSMVVDLGRMSIAAYHNDEYRQMVDALEQEHWVCRSQLVFQSGAQADVWERKLDGQIQRVVAFKGTDFDAFNHSKDILADAKQFLGGPQASAEYRDARAFALQQIAEKDRNPQLSLTLTGHSLAGGYVQRINLETGVSSVVFNAATLNQLDSMSAMMDRSDQANLAKNTLLNIRAKGDIVSQFGQPLWKEYGNPITVVPVRPTTGPLWGDYSAHDVKVILDSIDPAWRTPPGRAAPSAIQPPISAQSKPAEVELYNQDVPRRPPSVFLPPPSPPRPLPSALVDSLGLTRAGAAVDRGGIKMSVEVTEGDDLDFSALSGSATNVSGKDKGTPKPAAETAGKPAPPAAPKQEK
jgi:hypothetical protein